MISFIKQAQRYATYHRNSITRYTNMAGIPLLLLSMMILFGFVHVVILHVADVSVAYILVLALLIVYCRLNWQLGLALVPVFLFLLWIAHFFSDEGPTSFSLWSFLIIFICGISLELFAHFVEDKRPVLTDHLNQLFIAPLFVMAELFFMAGLMDKLKDDMYGKKLSKKEPQ